jgi:chromosome partitioning protein
VKGPVSHEQARIIAVANQKGGVGKSTTAVSLGAALAELGHRVLVVDLDPQGNASTGLGIRHEARQVTVYDVLAAEAPIEGAIVSTPVQNLWAVPSTIDLAGAEIELVSQFSRELRLRKAIEPLKDGAFEFVFLDCPPSLGLLTVNALAAAEELIVPIQCEYYALEGLGQLLRNVRLVQQNVNPELRLTGIVMTMFDPRTKLSEQVVAEVRRFFGDRVYETIIPRTVRLSEAPGFGTPITIYDPRSRGAESYRDLAREVVAKLPDASPLPMIEDLAAVAVVPPPAEPTRAPRPLVRPEEEVEAEVTVEPDEALGVRARMPEAVAQVEAQTRPAGGEVEERAVAVESVSSRTWPQLEDVVEPAAREEGEEELAEGVPDSRAGLEAEDRAAWPVDLPVPSQRPDHGAEVTGTLEQDHVITMEELEEASGGAPTPEAEEEPEPEAPPKRRWGLFRRGGDR